MAISKNIEHFMENSSWIRKMFEEGNALKKKIGEENVCDFSLGNPILEPPASFHKSLQEVVNDKTPGQHRYMPNAGYVETRKHIADILSEDGNLTITADHIIMTCGAAAGLNVIFKTLLNPGDEVIIFSPYFAEYIFYVNNNAGTPRIVETNDDFEIDINNLEKAINNKTKAVLINSPNNPTGIVYNIHLLKSMASLLERKRKDYKQNIYLISDEPYKKIVYDNIVVPSVLKLYNESIVVNSHSKDLAIPGERIGYICVSPQCKDWKQIVGGAVFCNRTLGFVNAPAIMQRVIRRLKNVSVDIRDYQKKRDLFFDSLVEMGYELIKPKGAFYLFPKSPIKNELEFVKKLNSKNILTVPGRGFGRSGYFRISYCVAQEVIEKSLEGFKEAIKTS